MNLSLAHQIWRRLHRDQGFSEILSGTFWAFGARIGTSLFTLTSTLLIARLYGAEAMGNLLTITSILSIAMVVTDLGSSSAILRMIPEHIKKFSVASAARLYVHVESLVLAVSLMVGMVIYLGAEPLARHTFDHPALARLIRFATIMLGLKTLMYLNTHAVRAIKFIRTYALMMLLPHILFNGLLIIGKCLSILNPALFPAQAQVGAWATTGLVGSAIMHVTFRHRSVPNTPIGPNSIKSILSISLPMMLSSSMYVVMTQSGVLILGMYWPQNVVGHYAVAVKLALLISFMITALNAIAAPTYSELYHTQQIGEMLRVARKSARLAFWMTLPIFVVLVAGGYPILYFFRPEFAVAYPALVILVIGQFFNSIAGSTAQLMNMTGSHNQQSHIMLLAAILNIALNFVLTPKYNIIGAAVAATASNIMWNSLALWWLYRRFGLYTGYFPFRIRQKGC